MECRLDNHSHRMCIDDQNVNASKVALLGSRALETKKLFSPGATTQSIPFLVAASWMMRRRPKSRRRNGSFVSFFDGRSDGSQAPSQIV